jgi:UDP-N-acetylmuramate dehydrogenase
MLIQENFSLKKYNTFGIDVKAKYFAVFNSLEQLKAILAENSTKTKPLLILGGGSNILFTKDYEGLVLKNEIKGISLESETQDNFFVKAGAGENWNDFVNFCIENNYCGLENLALIPGNVGASPMQNIGAYGVEIKDIFYELEAFHIPSKEVHRFDNESCEFGYRESVFKNKYKGQYIILNVSYKLAKKATFKTSYGAINEELKKMGVADLSISAVGQAVRNIRNSKLPNPAVLGNAGSFFKNPVISSQDFDRLKQAFPKMPFYEQPEGKVKLAAGWLIEHCGWKGKRIGDAGVHELQALVLVNYQGATGSEIFDLSSKIIASVYAQFGVRLEREVNII